MIAHIVVWNLNAQDEPERAADAEAIRDALESLLDVIPEIVTLRVSRNAVGIEGNWDLGLVSEFATPEDLRTYIEHPAHQAAVKVVRARVNERSAIDLEI